MYIYMISEKIFVFLTLQTYGSKQLFPGLYVQYNQKDGRYAFPDLFTFTSANLFLFTIVHN